MKLHVAVINETLPECAEMHRRAHMEDFVSPLLGRVVDGDHVSNSSCCFDMK